MIDIHSHIIFGVDDGAKNENDTRDLLEESYNQGVKGIIATPHRRQGMFETDLGIIIENFKRVEEIAKEVADDLKIYLGSEIFYKDDEIENIENKIHPTLAGTDYILVEFPYEMRYKEINRALSKILFLGITPVIAHVERYINVDEDGIQKLINMGVYIQVNAESVLKTKLIGDKHKHFKKRAKKYLDKNLVHFIASDMHSMKIRRTYMREAFEQIKSKYGLSKALELFEENQEKLLMNKII
ncbi:CpsB/CapC family capsule biosynthesis tyrosine phosphatase [uncultured Gemella sp.]|uniref:CpsB/CapC family capsule biosynthesis tyrosine phosphatase n=1 Tax=uncultured Gemella sp. TaxID=254352 RepID=UPI0028D76CCB|nr:CpsB/CapC family capsule biosynthesis tyrosine phosphatase [uncultured Gemella sp.]